MWYDHRDFPFTAAPIGKRPCCRPRRTNCGDTPSTRAASSTVIRLTMPHQPPDTAQSARHTPPTDLRACRICTVPATRKASIAEFRSALQQHKQTNRVPVAFVRISGTCFTPFPPYVAVVWCYANAYNEIDLIITAHSRSTAAVLLRICEVNHNHITTHMHSGQMFFCAHLRSDENLCGF